MSQDTIPLEVIYNPLDSYTHKNFYDSSSVHNPPPPPQSKKPKKKSHSCCARACICLWTLFVLFSLIMFFATLTVGYFKLRGCFHSEHYEFTELFTSASYVKEIRFEVVTGAVIFDTHDRDDIVVKLYKSARESYLLEDIDANVAVQNGVLTIHSYSPAFDFSECHFSYIEVIFPYTMTSPIDITGTVRAGFVELSYLINLGDVNLNVELGAIEVDGVNANTFDAQTGLGYIDATALYAVKRAEFIVDTGFARTRYITTPQLEVVTKYGTSMNVESYTDEAIVYSRYGYATLLRPSHLTANKDQILSVGTFYGKSIASYEQLYNVEFEVSGKYGERTVAYENTCEVNEESGYNKLKGTCSLYTFEPITKLSVSSIYGNSLFVQNAADEDSLNNYPEAENKMLD